MAGDGYLGVVDLYIKTAIPVLLELCVERPSPRLDPQAPVPSQVLSHLIYILTLCIL